MRPVHRAGRAVEPCLPVNAVAQVPRFVASNGQVAEQVNVRRADRFGGTPNAREDAATGAVDPAFTRLWAGRRAAPGGSR